MLLIFFWILIFSSSANSQTQNLTENQKKMLENLENYYGEAKNLLISTGNFTASSIFTIHVIYKNTSEVYLENSTTSPNSDLNAPNRPPQIVIVERDFEKLRFLCNTSSDDFLEIRKKIILALDCQYFPKRFVDNPMETEFETERKFRIYYFYEYLGAFTILLCLALVIYTHRNSLQVVYTQNSSGIFLNSNSDSENSTSPNSITIFESNIEKIKILCANQKNLTKINLQIDCKKFAQNSIIWPLLILWIAGSLIFLSFCLTYNLKKFEEENQEEDDVFYSCNESYGVN
ncbi:unnamed protein product [Caenorhabditis angaria]|uniref:Uncharacterized protein n=1 Tax=Caenorhabditis angaria TaxID=860376 RepID=A0A9P1MXZ1_9PELO|nr:unnamed protein product [Caenorhabditis angaria]